MFEFVCEECGKVRKVHCRKLVGRWCSRECYNKSRFGTRRIQSQVTWCVFQPESVICGDRKCENCGWNPVVANARLDKFLEEHHEFTL